MTYSFLFVSYCFESKLCEGQLLFDTRFIVRISALLSKFILVFVTVSYHVTSQVIRERLKLCKIY